jgi:hypothetical protein
MPEYCAGSFCSPSLSEGEFAVVQRRGQAAAPSAGRHGSRELALDDQELVFVLAALQAARQPR